jgi:medium-chain acyl-[acyl-carrier-protein] hydrolase
MPDLLEHLTRDLLPLLDVPFAFFGHSMGALVAYEFARHLHDRFGTVPRHVFVSAARAPHLPDPDPPMSTLPDSAFLEQMTSLNGFPVELRNNHEFLQLILPTLRADIALCDSYSYVPGDPLPCPITVFGGRDDRRVTRAHLTSWAVHTAGRFRIRFCAGDHFFLASAHRQVIRAMRADLAPVFSLVAVR